MQKEIYGDILNKENLRITKSRQMVLDILKDSPPKSIDEIFMIAKERDAKVSISTIYRTCETLSQKGLLYKSNFVEDGKARYEYPGKQHKHHAVCMNCHNIISIDDCPFGEFDEVMKSKYHFDVKSHSIEIYGYCSDCKLKQPQ
ncbi:Fur family transcriptional regulator, ferric uptake regulator [Sporobacter termitidis DSM 10068]|uniref:Fur family transcriptional regulator, ferric uptake regulator n=1 Tax=Sporobacter termitidis DSM 10068 TaxID=1123282 RepID=A0A1M5VHP6_9FIRM|nr:Fur family transcriptional regulator [Sporobacter termitidis]SHH74433.1 Fur family transcriptional regulator, ferric uptake regulator [Sporobacter termitidis DSM 10068]